MILKSIKVERFRGLGRIEPELGPGITVVRGPNESGKSTLLTAVQAVFYANPGAASNWTSSARC